MAFKPNGTDHEVDGGDDTPSPRLARQDAPLSRCSIRNFTKVVGGRLSDLAR
jgi:hypothetical protein